MRICSVALIFIALFPNVSFADKYSMPRVNFEETKNAEELAQVQNWALYIFKNPEQAAAIYASSVAGLPEYGWQTEWSVQFKTLDLIAYYFSLEKAQFYASAGRWMPPQHFHQQSHVKFYKAELNPDSRAYSWGHSQETTYVFAEKFLTALVERGSKADLEVIKVLAQTGRKFWNLMIFNHVFSNPRATTAFLADLIAEMYVVRSYDTTMNITDIVIAIFKRQESASTQDAEQLLNALYGRININSEAKIARIYSFTYDLENGGPCVKLLEAVDQKHSLGARIIVDHE